ncbi:ABC transporter ATP-binding protein [Cereibacter azotoformans]|uniref:Cu-processing system ATP-binding protein n=1 Tax=Cereibacter azotoformans TaxID=43057 RepID=A0A2T5K9Y4_9RHOB|nr:ABC transporter ATP-binding protein [Cereibacter azotoformans]AXQ95895.1 ABC transporter ATP-binding protein [Cereibacter sphaeroides]PTR19221.1 Cu-processing system ATP-binding protein [Cereibacter azotoformans]UIJ32428.1 ABC transporter ATP-binding protein [Cereibacter azotoformans]
MLTLSQVTRTFGGLTALDDISLSVTPGERVALLGHNGAGKSTLMKIVLGLIAADRGRISVGGHAPGSRAARAVTAYLPENAAFHPALTGLETLRHYLRLRGEDARKAGDLLDRVGLGAAAGRRIGTYSKGMRQRVGLAQALIGHPRLLVLDEPTSGLDPVSRRDFYALLAELAAEGAAILLSSHALTEVEARTDRIVILSGGRLMANDTLANLRRQAALPIRLQVSARPGAADEVAERLKGGRRNGVTVDLSCAPDEKLDRLGAITALGPMVEDVEILPPSLEDLYSHYSRRPS